MFSVDVDARLRAARQPSGADPRRDDSGRRLPVHRRAGVATRSARSGGCRARISLQAGQYYDGTLTSIGYSDRRACSRAEAVLARADASRSTASSSPAATFTTRLCRTRADYGFSPLMFASALLQYSSSDRAFSSNLRFRWEYRPGSELFVVYTDERDTTDPLVRAADAGARPEEPRVRREDQSAAAVLKEDSMAVTTRCGLIAIAALAGRGRGASGSGPHRAGARDPRARHHARHAQRHGSRQLHARLQLHHAADDAGEPAEDEGRRPRRLVHDRLRRPVEPAAGRRRVRSRPATIAPTKPRSPSSTPSIT